MNEKPVHQFIRPAGIPSGEAFGVPDVWRVGRFAPSWLADSLREALHHGPEARRREVIFAVCFAESYLFEWIRDEVLRGEYRQLADYFPEESRRGIREKYRELPRRLHGAGLLPELPDFGGPHGEQWNRLVEYRDSLIHAVVSRPDQSTGNPWDEIRQLRAGWALDVVRERVRRLHLAARTEVPAWLLNVRR